MTTYITNLVFDTILILPYQSDMKVWFFKRERHGFFFLVEKINLRLEKEYFVKILKKEVCFQRMKSSMDFGKAIF